MTTINTTRLIIAAFVASVIFFVTDGMMHEMILKSDWTSVYSVIKATTPEPDASSMAFFAVFEIGRGLLCLLIYVLMRPFFGPGPKTAIIAAVCGWLAFSVAGPAQFIPLGFLSVPLWLKMVGLQLVTTIVGTLAGAALYKGTNEG